MIDVVFSQGVFRIASNTAGGLPFFFKKLYLVAIFRAQRF